MAIAGCPNDCAKAHFNDFGIMGVTKPIYLKIDVLDVEDVLRFVITLLQEF